MSFDIFAVQKRVLNKIIPSANFESMYANLVDAILMGIPSSTVVPEIARKYGYEIADLNRVYNQLNKEYNNLMDEGVSLNSAKNELRELMYQSGPLGAIRSDLTKKYQEVVKDIESNEMKRDDISKQIEKTSNKLAETERRAQKSSTLGGAFTSGDIWK